MGSKLRRANQYRLRRVRMPAGLGKRNGEGYKSGEPYDVNAIYGGPIGGFGSEGVVSFALPPNTPLPPNYNGINWSAAPSQVKPRIPLNAKTFDLTLRVFYDEWNRFTVTPGDTPGLALKHVDWVAYPGQQVEDPAVVIPLFLRGSNLFAYLNLS